MRSDGKVVEVRLDGSERPLPDTPMRPMTEAEIEVAAAADPDARPMTSEELRSSRRVPRVKSLRRLLASRKTNLRCGITFRSGRCGRCEPDQPARAYLLVIAGDPEGVSRVLNAECRHARPDRSNVLLGSGQPPPTRHGRGRSRRSSRMQMADDSGSIAGLDSFGTFRT